MARPKLPWLVVVVIILCAIVVVVTWPKDTIAKREAVVRKLTELRLRYEQDPTDQEALNGIRKMINAKTSFARTRACVTLGELGPLAEPAVDDLVAALRSGDGYVEREAAIALGKIGPGANEAVGPLTAMLDREYIDVASFSAESLGQIGKSALSAVPALQKASRSSDQSLAYHARKALLHLEKSELMDGTGE